jgi:hypothetical protein
MTLLTIRWSAAAKFLQLTWHPVAHYYSTVSAFLEKFMIGQSFHSSSRQFCD